jgi:hypothetical protein
VGASCPLGGDGLPSEEIDAPGDWLEMVRVAAQTVPAEMIEVQALRHRASSGDVERTVG